MHVYRHAVLRHQPSQLQLHNSVQGRLSTDASSVKSIAPPSPLITVFAFTCAWPMTMAYNVRLDLKTKTYQIGTPEKHLDD